MFCTRCGNAFKEGDKFCSACGNAVEQQFIKEEKDGAVFLTNSEGISFPQQPEFFTQAEPVVEEKVKSVYKSVLVKCIIIAIAICAAIEIGLILLGGFDEIHAKVLGSMGNIIFYGIAASVYIDLYEKSSYKNLAVSGLVLAALGFIYSTLYVWGIIADSEYFEFTWKVMAAFWTMIIGIALSAKILLTNFKNENYARWLVPTTTISIAVTCSLILVTIFFEIDNEFFVRILLVSGIISSFGTIAVALVNKIK